jgi:hypothetical protein
MGQGVQPDRSRLGSVAAEALELSVLLRREGVHSVRPPQAVQIRKGLRVELVHARMEVLLPTLLVRDGVLLGRDVMTDQMDLVAMEVLENRRG